MLPANFMKISIKNQFVIYLLMSYCATLISHTLVFMRNYDVESTHLDPGHHLANSMIIFMGYLVQLLIGFSSILLAIYNKIKLIRWVRIFVIWFLLVTVTPLILNTVLDPVISIWLKNSNSVIFVKYIVSVVIQLSAIFLVLNKWSGYYLGKIYK